MKKTYIYFTSIFLGLFILLILKTDIAHATFNPTYTSSNGCIANFSPGALSNFSISSDPVQFLNNSTNKFQIKIPTLPANSGNGWRIEIINCNMGWIGCWPQQTSTNYSDGSTIDLNMTLTGEATTKIENKSLFLKKLGTNGANDSCLLGTFDVKENVDTGADLTVTPTCLYPGATVNYTIARARVAGTPFVGLMTIVFEASDAITSIATDASGNASGTYTLTNFPATPDVTKYYKVTLTDSNGTSGINVTRNVDYRANAAACTGTTPPPAGGTAVPPTRFEPCNNIPDPTEKKACTDCFPTGIYTAIGCIPITPAEFARSVIQVLVVISIGIAFSMLAYGAFLCITSKGNSQQTGACQQTITSAVVGLLMIIFSLVIVRIIFGPSGVFPGTDTGPWINIF